VKILLAEDTRDMNRVLSMALAHEGYVVDSCFDGEEALTHAMSNGYDAMILDIMMPKMSGIEVLKEARKKNIVTPIMMLTAKAEIDDRVEGLDAGADDYLTKPFAMKELLARVRAMTRRKREYSSEILKFGDVLLNGDSFELKAQNSVRLSVKEFEMLQLMIVHAGHRLSVQYLLEHIWEGDEAATESTVKLYIAYLKSKLAAVSMCVHIEEVDGHYQLLAGEENG